MILQFIDYAGVAVFAVSGALAAGRKSLDLLGVVIIALVTAIGGGTVRDVLLDRHPVFWIADPAYIVIIVVSALLTVTSVRLRPPPLSALQLADALGLAFFAISGAQVAESRGVAAAVIVMMGTITGVFGGVLRDVLCNEIPMILRKGNIYATAAIVGVSLYVLCMHLDMSKAWASAIGMTTIAALRIAAIAWNLSLPVFHIGEESDDGNTRR
jgi:uncharacterized membrane protein YeiH